MIVVYYSWKDLPLPRPVSGLDVMVFFAWAETAIAFTVDLMRFYSPRMNRVVAGLPFYGGLMRQVERSHFNASTYYLAAASILITAHRFGWCREATLVMSLAVLGVADPAAAWTRYHLAKRGIGNERVLGLLAFFASSFLVLWGISWHIESPLHWEHIAGIGLIVALVESYTKYWVQMVHPVTRRLQRAVFHKATVWLFRLYPDDNLMIPLTTALLIGVFSLMT